MGSLMRSRIDRRIAGICGGIAQMQGWDSTVVRLVWVALVLFAGTGVLAYLVLWLILPEEPYGLPPYAGYPPSQTTYPYGQQPTQYPGGPTYPPPPPQGPSQNS